jgi:hypothetical protein
MCINPAVTVYTPEGEAFSLASTQEMVLFYRDIFQIELDKHYEK